MNERKSALSKKWPKCTMFTFTTLSFDFLCQTEFVFINCSVKQIKPCIKFGMIMLNFK